MHPPLKILLVEDDPTEASLLRATLAGSGTNQHEIEHVRTLPAARTRLARQPTPDIVLFDLSLTNGTGHATFDELFPDHHQVPVVVLTSRNDDAMAAAAMESGAQDYLVKGSVTGEVLARAIRHAVERHQLQSALRERVKEQAGLLAISQTLHRELPLAQRLDEIAGHLATAMQFPEFCHATVSIDGANATVGPERTAGTEALTAPITVDGAPRGQLVVCYGDPDLSFLNPEEPTLLQSAADAISRWIGRQQTVQQLVLEERRLRLLVSQLPGAVWTTDRALRITSADGEGLSRSGIRSDELIGRSVLDVLGSDPSAEMTEGLQAALAGESREFEQLGRGRWWRTRVEPRTDADGQVVGTVCLTMDITTERRQQSAIDVADQRFRGLFANTLDAIVLADERGVYLDANPAASALTGYDLDELMGMAVWDLTPDSHQVTRDVALAMWQDFLDEGVLGGEFPIQRKDGTVVEIEFRAVADIVPGVHLSTLRDISERKRTAVALAASEARFGTIAASTQDIVYQVRLVPSVSFDYVSPALEAVTGLTPQALHDDPTRYLERLFPDGGVATFAQTAATADPAPSFGKVHFQHAAGHWIWLENHHTVVTEDGQAVALLGVIRDATAREDTERVLREALRAEQEATERLRAVDRVKGSFLQAISHELRTPLTSVLGYAHTLLSDKISPEQVEEFHQRLLANAKRLDVLLRDLLDIQRLDRGIVHLNLQAVDVAAVVCSVAADINLTGRTLHLDDTPMVAEVDAHQIERIIHNLIANAVKHTFAGSTIWVSLDSADAGVTIIVSDDGPGIPLRDRERVFKPFWQAPAMAATASPGTGIGLALVRQLATLHGGRAWVEPRDGGGASFHVHLPGRTGDAPATPLEEISPAGDHDLVRFREFTLDTVDQLHTSRQPDAITGVLLTWIQQVDGQLMLPTPGDPNVLDIDLSLGTPQPLRAAAPPGSTARRRLDDHLPFLLLTARRTLAEQASADGIATDNIVPATGVLRPEALARALDQLRENDVIVVLTIDRASDVAPSSRANAVQLLRALAARLSRTGDLSMLTRDDELVLVLPDTPLDRAALVVDRIHRSWTEEQPGEPGRIVSAFAPVTGGAARHAVDHARAQLRAAQHA